MGDCCSCRGPREERSQRLVSSAIGRPLFSVDFGQRVIPVVTNTDSDLESNLFGGSGRANAGKPLGNFGGEAPAHVRCDGPAKISLLASKNGAPSFVTRKEDDVVGFKSEWMISNVKGPWIIQTVQAHGVGWPKPCKDATHFCNVIYKEAFRVVGADGKTAGVGASGHIPERPGSMWNAKTGETKRVKTRGDTQKMGINVKKASLGFFDSKKKPSDQNPTGRGEECDLCKVHVNVDMYIDDAMTLPAGVFPEQANKDNQVDYVLLEWSQTTDCMCRTIPPPEKPTASPFIALFGGQRSHCSWQWEWNICSHPECNPYIRRRPATSGPPPVPDLPPTTSPSPMTPPDEPERPRTPTPPPVTTEPSTAPPTDGGVKQEPERPGGTAKPPEPPKKDPDDDDSEREIRMYPARVVVPAGTKILSVHGSVVPPHGVRVMGGSVRPRLSARIGN